MNAFVIVFIDLSLRAVYSRPAFIIKIEKCMFAHGVPEQGVATLNCMCHIKALYCYGDINLRIFCLYSGVPILTDFILTRHDSITLFKHSQYYQTDMKK